MAGGLDGARSAKGAETRKSKDVASPIEDSLLSYDPSARARHLLGDLRVAFERAEYEANLYDFGAAYAILSAAVRPLVGE